MRTAELHNSRKIYCEHRQFFLARAARTFFIDNVKNKYDSLGTAVASYMPRGYNEIMHSVKPSVFYDVNEEGNIMHSMASKYKEGSLTEVIHIDIKVPFRYKPLNKVMTKTLNKDPKNAIPLSQWEFRRINN